MEAVDGRRQVVSHRSRTSRDGGGSNESGGPEAIGALVPNAASNKIGAHRAAGLSSRRHHLRSVPACRVLEYVCDSPTVSRADRPLRREVMTDLHTLSLPNIMMNPLTTSIL